MLTALDIQRAVCAHYGLPLRAMTDDCRDRYLAWPRQTAMYLARELTRLSLPRIGRRFGGRDHTTVIHALKAVQHRLETDPETADAVAAIRERLAS